MACRLKRTKEIHPTWEEWQQIPHELKNRLFMKKSLIGKWHYHYENKNGIIGLIRIQMPVFDLKKFGTYRYVWEACGILEYRRFGTKAKAEDIIYNALKEKK